MPKPPRLPLVPLFLALLSPAFGANPSASGSNAPAAPEAAAAEAPPSSDDLQKQLADTRDQLATALHSFSLLHDENAQLRDQADKNAAQIDSDQRTIADLRGQASGATRLPELQAQLREAQDQIAALASENAQLRRRLALSGPPPSGGNVPTRPAQP